MIPDGLANRLDSDISTIEKKLERLPEPFRGCTVSWREPLEGNHAVVEVVDTDEETLYSLALPRSNIVGVESESNDRVVISATVLAYAKDREMSDIGNHEIYSLSDKHGAAGICVHCKNTTSIPLEDAGSGEQSDATLGCVYMFTKLDCSR